MNSRSAELFRLVLRSVITDTSVDLPEDFDLRVADVVSLAKSQDVLQLICHGIRNNAGILPEKAENERIMEAYRFTNNGYTLKTAKQVLSDARIPYVPLKGAVIKELDLYPEKWMRGSCDTDILIKEESLERTIEALVAKGFVTDSRKEYHDVSLYFGGAHLELHFNICENICRVDRVLSHVWEYVEQVSEYEYREIPEFFIFHIIAHILYHFLRGGSNIKQYIDFWLLKKNRYYDEQKLMPFLRKCRLVEFYRVLSEATEAWFGEKEESVLSERIWNQVLRGGLANRQSNSDAISVYIGGGKLQYLFRSAFIPLREMKWYYPALEKRPYLLPVYYAKRLYSKTLGTDKTRAQKLLKVNTKKDSKQESDAINLLSEMGLD